jgi:hypothetical protein
VGLSRAHHAELRARPRLHETLLSPRSELRGRRSVARAFLNLAPDEIAARLQAAASAAAGAPVLVRVGDEVHGYANVGVDLPRGRRSAAEGRLLRNRVRAAARGGGRAAGGDGPRPSAEGDVRESIQVRDVTVSRSDLASIVTPRAGPFGVAAPGILLEASVAGAGMRG